MPEYKENRLVEDEAAFEEFDGSEIDVTEGTDLLQDEPEFSLRDELEAKAGVLSSQLRLAYLTASKMLGKALYISGLGWHVWTGKHWERDKDDLKLIACVQDRIRDLAYEALVDKDLRADLVKCQTKTGIAGVVSLMRSIKGMSADVEDMDSDPYLLNLANGVLDLRQLEPGDDGEPVDWKSLELLPHDPAYRMTQITRAAYDPDATSDLLDTFMCSSLPDENVRDYLRQALGLGLLGVQEEHLLPILQGAGRNGKGVFYNAVHWAMGGYSAIAPASLFNVTKDDPNKPSPAFLELRAKRFAWMSETERKVRLSVARIKAFTGGDPITGRYLRQSEYVTFNPSHSIFLITNDKPQLTGDDGALWERVRLVPWDVVISKEDRDPRLGQKLHAAADAILLWMLSGLADYRAHGLVEPDRIAASTADYRASQDTVGRFISDRCETGDPSTGDTIKEIHREYLRWCRANGVMDENVLAEREFGTALDGLGYVNKKSNGRRFRSGLRLLPEQPMAGVQATTQQLDQAAIAEINRRARESGADITYNG